MTERALGARQRATLPLRRRVGEVCRELERAHLEGAPDAKLQKELRALRAALAETAAVADVEPCLACPGKVDISMPPKTAFAVAEVRALHVFEKGNAVPEDESFAEAPMHLVVCGRCVKRLRAAAEAQRVEAEGARPGATLARAAPKAPRAARRPSKGKVAEPGARTAPKAAKPRRGRS